MILGEDKYLTLKYENLVSMPSLEIRKVCSFLEIPFDDDLLNLKDTSTVSEKSYVLPRFDETKLIAFRNNLTSNQIATIESYCMEEMGLLGSNYFSKNPTIDLKNANYMINMDMVGRLREDKTLAISGTGTAPIWNQVLNATNPASRYAGILALG